MNRANCDILKSLAQEPFLNQRELAGRCRYSLGVINRSLRELFQAGYVDEGMDLTDKARKELVRKAPQNAVILAAGYGLRMVPVNREIPKGLLEVEGERLIERLIRQLHEAGIFEIYVVVGFMKESYEYLMDDYGVQLIVNPEYAAKNNLHSLKLAASHLSNTYVLPCDIWCERNPFQARELYSWYMVSDLVDNESMVRVNRKRELIGITAGQGGNAMVGVTYLLEEDAKGVRERLEKLCADPLYDQEFWEAALFQGNRMTVEANVVHASEVVEINTYEQLRELDSHSGQLESDAISVIEQVFGVRNEEIEEIEVLKKGMTNRSFLFRCKGKKYIMRIPGEGTEKLINRAEEADVYRVLKTETISDSVLYLNPKNGYKITEFLEGARVCDPFCPGDVRVCMRKLREFHEKRLKVAHTFDIFRQIEFYEALWNGEVSAYRDYPDTKKNVLSLKPYLEAQAGEFCLTHIDAVPDNFLFARDERGDETLRLIDWDYAGMQDPHVDLAMFCIYAMYDREQADALIDAYFTVGCPKAVRIKIYAYIAACGLLWSNWCEYKRGLGVEFGEYSLRQYRYAKEYYRIVEKELNKSDTIQ